MSEMKLKHIFGIDCSRKDLIDYLNDHCYVYVTSRLIIFNEIPSKEQKRILFGNEFDRLLFISFSPNKKYLFFGLNSSNEIQLILLELNGNLSIERKRLIHLKESFSSNEILSFQFSNNSKYLLILSLVLRSSIRINFF